MPKILSQALAHLQSITRTSPQECCRVAYAHSPCPFRGSSPLQRLSIAKSPTLSGMPDSSHTAELVAPPGFLTLSTPCSLGDLPGLFHPGSAHGVRPSRPFSFVKPLTRKPKARGAVRPLGRRAPRGLPSRAVAPGNAARLPTGTPTPPKAREPAPGVNRETGPFASLGLMLRGLLPVAAPDATNTRTPLTRFSVALAS